MAKAGIHSHEPSCAEGQARDRQTAMVLWKSLLKIFRVVENRGYTLRLEGRDLASLSNAMMQEIRVHRVNSNQLACTWDCT